MRTLEITSFDNDIAPPRTTKVLRRMVKDTTSHVLSQLGHKDPGFPRHILLSMEPGQSFFMPMSGEEAVKFRMRMLVAASRCGCEITSKIISEGEAKGVRIWKLSGPVEG